jgi:hypothetical protein
MNPGILYLKFKDHKTYVDGSIVFVNPVDGSLIVIEPFLFNVV